MKFSINFLITLFLAWVTVSISTTVPPPTAAGVGIVESLHAPVAPVDTAESPFQIELDLNSELNGPTSDTKDVNNATFFFLNVVGLIVGLVVVAFIFYKAVITVVAFIFYKTVIIAAQVEEEKVSTTTTATEVQTDIEAAIK